MNLDKPFCHPENINIVMFLTLTGLMFWIVISLLALLEIINSVIGMAS